MSDETNLEAINRKLDTLIRLVAYQTVQKMTLSEGAPLLRRFGFTASEIAAIYDSTANAVNVRLAEAKKKKKSKGV
jgi:predicted double-glycine peptidase